MFTYYTYHNNVTKFLILSPGSPTQYSDCDVTIIVVEESHHPPVIQGSKIFYVIVSPPYGMTKIGVLDVLDEDKSDIHQFRIAGGNDDGLFQVQQETGVIEGRPTEGAYSLRMEVTDGNFVDNAVIRIVVNEFNDKLKTQSVSVVIHGVDVPEFINSKMVVGILIIALEKENIATAPIQECLLTLDAEPPRWRFCLCSVTVKRIRSANIKHKFEQVWNF